MVSLTSVSHAQTRSLAILALASDDDDALASAFTDALRREAGEEAGFVLSDSRVSLSQMTMAQDCEITEAACRTRIASALGVQFVIYGELHRASPDSYQVQVHMFGAQRGAEASATRTVRAQETSRADLARHARALLGTLSGGAPDQEGESEAPPAVATVNPDVQPLNQASDAEPAFKQSARPDYGWLGYTLIGVGAVSLGLTVFSWTQIKSAENDSSLKEFRTKIYDRSMPNLDACDEISGGRLQNKVDARTYAAARDACDRGTTFERLQYVFLGVGVVAAGVGTYFLLDRPSSKSAPSNTARLAITPSVGRSSAALTVQLAL